MSGLPGARGARNWLCGAALVVASVLVPVAIADVGLGTFAGVTPAASRVDAQLARYRHEGQGLAPEYRAAVTSQLHRYLLRAAALGVNRLAEGVCEVANDVRIPGPGAFPLRPEVARTPAQEAFEEGFFRTTAVTCVPGASPADVAEVYMDPSFRRVVMPNVEAITMTEDRICISTGGVAGVVEPTAICMVAARMDKPDLVVVHSVLDENGTDPDLGLVYYRDSLVAFVASRLPDGTPATGVWRMTQLRAQDLNPFAATLLRRTSSRTTADIQAELVRRLGG